MDNQKTDVTQEKKFELLPETQRTAVIDGKEHMMYRIKALRDFGDVKAGQMGGWVEKEDNLSQEGNSFVYDNAIVSGNARVEGDAKVKDNAIVEGEARVTESAVVKNNARVANSAVVGGKAQVMEDATVLMDAQVKDQATVKGSSMVGGKAQVEGEAVVKDYAILNGHATVKDKAQVSGQASVIGVISQKDDKGVIIQDNAQVSGRALVNGNAKIEGNAKVDDRSWVMGNAVVSGNAHVKHDAKITGSAVVTEDAVVENKAQVRGEARIMGEARVKDEATVGDRVVLKDKAQAKGKADVTGNAVVGGNKELADGMHHLYQDKTLQNILSGNARTVFGKVRKFVFAILYDNSPKQVPATAAHKAEKPENNFEKGKEAGKTEAVKEILKAARLQDQDVTPENVGKTFGKTLDKNEQLKKQVASLKEEVVKARKVGNLELQQSYVNGYQEGGKRVKGLEADLKEVISKYANNDPKVLSKYSVPREERKFDFESAKTAGITSFDFGKQEKQPAEQQQQEQQRGWGRGR